MHIADLHIIPQEYIFCRNQNGVIEPFTKEPYTVEQIKSLLSAIAPDYIQILQSSAKGDIDKSYSINGIRCRVNIYKTMRGICATIRILAGNIPSMTELGLPVVVQNLIHKDHGLILFTASTGNGKSTSIASMLEAINETQKKRAILIEDPIEYIYETKQSVFSQREVGRDVEDFATGLRAALREDPDIIMIGEMRDRETISAALTAAESGHLVFSTLHSADCIQATDRILQYFPSSQHDIIAAQFANALEAVIAQKLLPRKRREGRVAAFEVLLRTPAIQNLIRTGKTFNLHTYMTRNEGMMTMNESVNDLARRGVIAL